MRLNLYSALTILGIVLFVASVAAILFLIGIADYIDSPTALFLFFIACSMLLGSLCMVVHAAHKREPIIIRILDFLAGEDNE